MQAASERNLAHDLILPTLLFCCLGAMTWAVRGCSGFGATAGCIFAGLMWGVAWWYISREPGAVQHRRYTSGWIILALTIGIGISGARGWAQWSTLFQGKLQTHTAAGEWVPASPIYGFVWMFIAGMPWAGLGACFLAWCATERPTRWWHWALRFACGFGLSWILVWLFNNFPQYFMPLYRQLEAQYLDRENNNNLFRITNDNRAAIRHLGFYLGFLFFEICRRDWKNVTLILTVGLINGVGWAALQNWTWAEALWPGVGFNWWRCWESSGGISIGLGYGVAYYLVNRPEATPTAPPNRLAHGRINGEWLTTWFTVLGVSAFSIMAILNIYAFPALLILAVAGIGYYLQQRRKAENLEGVIAPPEDPNLERWAVYVGFFCALIINARNGAKGCANIYIQNEDYWSRVFWYFAGPAIIVVLLLATWQLLARPLPRTYQGILIPRAYTLIWIMLIVQNIIALMVTGPIWNWTEQIFAAYYLVLFVVTAIIFHHYHRRWQRSMERPEIVASTSR